MSDNDFLEILVKEDELTKKEKEYEGEKILLNKTKYFVLVFPAFFAIMGVGAATLLNIVNNVTLNLLIVSFVGAGLMGEIISVSEYLKQSGKIKALFGEINSIKKSVKKKNEEAEDFTNDMSYHDDIVELQTQELSENSNKSLIKKLVKK